MCKSLSLGEERAHRALFSYKYTLNKQNMMLPPPSPKLLISRKLFGDGSIFKTGLCIPASLLSDYPSTPIPLVSGQTGFRAQGFGFPAVMQTIGAAAKPTLDNPSD